MRKSLSIVLTALVLVGCANRGVGPQGGPKDSIPPTAVKSVPENGAVNFTGKRIEITFNEYIQLDNISANLLMSPPQQRPPDVRARGKRVVIQFADTLRDSTTYTIDFGAAICDYTEKNPLHGYSFGFSTGPTIDTLETTGVVLDAENLKPVKGIIVGIHEDLSDTAFTKHPFLRIARTDSAGFYRISNMHAGTYRLYAVDDVSRDNRLTPGEAIAFAERTISVTAPLAPDTTAVDTAATDSLAPSKTPAPNTIPRGDTLYLFKPQQQRLYLQRTTRDEQHRIRITFSSAPDSLPLIRPLTDSLNYHTYFSRHRDTVSIWLLDSASIRPDSLYFELRYRRTDSLFHLEWATDTVLARWRAPRLSAKAQEALERNRRNRRLGIKTNASKSFEIYDTLRLNTDAPMALIREEAMHLYERKDKDSTDYPVPFILAPHDTLPLQLLVIARLEPGKKYELCLDSAALTDVYGVTHIAGSYTLTLKTPEDYSTIRVKLEPFDPRMRIQVLNAKEKVLQEHSAQPDGALFQYLKPDAYYLRMYRDENGDGQWTTGSWEDKRQPEKVYVNKTKIQTKSNWDFEETWTYDAQ